MATHKGTMLIVIPTHRRTDRQHTLRALPEIWLDRTVLVCDEQDWNEFYGDPELSRGVWCVVYPADEPQTIAAKRAWIIRNSIGGALGCREKIVMFDDDLRFSVRPQEDEITLRQADVDDLDEHLNLLSTTLDSYAHAGWSMRQGNNNIKTDGLDNTRMCYTLGYRPEVLVTECELGRIGSREDMDYTLQLLRKGYENRVSALIAVDQWSGFAAPGGCSAEDRIQQSNFDSFDLEALHPGLVTVHYKTYAASVPRVEVRCAWKKALGKDQPVRRPGEWTR